MPKVTVSPKYQVVIPQAIREQLSLRPGQQLEVLLYENRVEMVPVKPMRQVRGFLKGIDTDVPRDTDRL